jgi:DNA-binding FadR family transcriptional regulator
MAEASEDGSLDNYLRADVEFHQTILAACHNEMIEQLASVLRNVFRITFSASAAVRLRSLGLHEHILIAIENRDADAAEQAMRTLIVKTNEMVQQEYRGGTRRRSKKQPAATARR